MTRSFTVEERRARLAYRHRLLPSRRTDDVARIAEDLVALHSSDPVTVYLSALARMAHPSLTAVEEALYETRSLVRHHAMRRTLWVATPTTVRRMHAAATRALVRPERNRTVTLLRESGIDDPESWLDDAEAQVLDDLRRHGPSTARELGDRIAALRHPLQLSPGTAWASTQSAHTRVLLALGFQGAIVRARPTGTWVNGAYRYAAADAWLPGGLGDLDLRESAAALAGHWLRRFGPATSADLQWWMGWTVATTKRALADAEAEAVELDGAPAWVAADDDPDPDPDPDPDHDTTWVALLPSLDPTTMGWKQRDWYLPEAAAAAFDRNGNAGPTIWVDGRVVGAWAQTRDGELRLHYFERIGAQRRREVEERRSALAASLGDTRLTVRFPGRIQSEILA